MVVGPGGLQLLGGDRSITSSPITDVVSGPKMCEELSETDGPMSSGWQSYAADSLLRDGRSVHIRAVRADDKQRLLDLFGRQSPESIHYRFAAAKSTLTDAELRYFTELDFDRHVGLAAVRGSGPEEEFLGVARYVRCDGGASNATHRAEFAVAVADADQGKGVGTLLLEHLAWIALQSGITTFEADVLGDNRRMFELLSASGFNVSGSAPGQLVHISFPTTDLHITRLSAADLH